MRDGEAGERQPAYCYRCGHFWTPRTESEPRRCPRCHSSRWDVPERRVRECRFCGREYRMGSLEDPCPSCGHRQNEPLSDRSLHCNQCDYDWVRRGDGLPKRCPLCRSADWNLPKPDRLMCQQCGHIWKNQSGHPSKCPRCQSRVWDRPSRAVLCQRCGHAWRMRSPRSDGTAATCPKCKSRRWNEPMVVVTSPRKGEAHYMGVRERPDTALVVCRGCGRRWYMRDGGNASCPECGLMASYRDRIETTSLPLWSSGTLELTYVVENGYGCVYLWDGDYPVACRYVHEVLRSLDTTIGDLVQDVNGGRMGDGFAALADDMNIHRDDHLQMVGYFRKRLSLEVEDATILALHFTGMGPEAIARRLSLDEGEVRRAFDRIMDAYTNSGIIVDDTIFTEDPFSHYR